MELTMTNNFGFCELNEKEMMMVDGGIVPWLVVAVAVGGAMLLTGCSGVSSSSSSQTTTTANSGDPCETWKKGDPIPRW